MSLPVHHRIRAAWSRYRLIEWLILTRNFLLLWGMWLALRTCGFARVRRWCGEFAATSGPADATDERAAWVERTAFLLRVAAEHSPGSVNCLPRSIVLWWLLHRAGLAPRLQIGVDPKSAGTFAHAWVEWRGTVLIDTPQHAARFTAFTETGL